MGTKQTKRPAQGHKPASLSLRQQLQRRGLFKEDLMKLEEIESPKLSDVILELMAPYQAAADTRDAFERLATLAVVAWNAALLDDAERQALLETAVNAIVDAAGEQWRQDTAETLQALVEQKLSRFAADRRFVVDFRVTETATKFHLAVATLARRLAE